MSIRDTIIKLLGEVNAAVASDDEPFNLDSVAFMYFIIMIEETFEIVFPDDLLIIQDVMTVSSIEVILKNLVESRCLS